MTYARPAPPSNVPRSDSAAWALMWDNGWHDSDPEPPARLPDQVNSAYNMLRNGFTEVQIRLAIQEQYGKAAKPTQAFKRGLELVIQEQRAARENMPELVQAMRLTVLNRAIQSGQLGAAAAVLRDMAPADASLDASGATLLVEVLQPGSSTTPVLNQGQTEPEAAAA